MMMSSRLRHISKSRENEEREKKKLFSFQLQEGISLLQLNQSLYPTPAELDKVHLFYDCDDIFKLHDYTSLCN